jgi:thiol-disulfide isomerase/thioredoxin
METGTITIRAAFEDIPLEGIFETYDFSKLSITGSTKLHNIYAEYANIRSDLGRERHELTEHYWTYRRRQFPGSVSENIARVADIANVIAQQKAFIEGFVSKNRNNVLSAFALNDNFIDPFSDNLDMFTLDEISSMIASLSRKVRESELGRALIEKADKAKSSAEGAKYTDLTLFDPEGNSVKLSDHVGRGNYVVLEFWGSWCAPCFNQIPFHKEMYRIYNPHGLEIISIALDFEKDSWMAGIERFQKYDWLQLSGIDREFTRTLQSSYNFLAVPTIIVIAPDGTIVDRSTGGPWLAKKLIEIFGNHFGDRY